MIDIKCDCCGKSMAVWLDVTVKSNATNPLLAVGALQKYAGTRQYCERCFRDVYMGERFIQGERYIGREADDGA